MEKGKLLRLTELITKRFSTETPSDERGVSLTSPEGADAVADLGRVAAGELSITQFKEKDSRYEVASDGTAGLVIDEESFKRLNGGDA